MEHRNALTSRMRLERKSKQKRKPRPMAWLSDEASCLPLRERSDGSGPGMSRAARTALARYWLLFESAMVPIPPEYVAPLRGVLGDSPVERIYALPVRLERTGHSEVASWFDHLGYPSQVAVVDAIEREMLA